MRCAFRLQNLTRPNGLSPQVDSVFMTKRGCNGKNKFYIFCAWTEQERKADLKIVTCSACSAETKMTTHYPLL